MLTPRQLARRSMKIKIYLAQKCAHFIKMSAIFESIILRYTYMRLDPSLCGYSRITHCWAQ